MATRRTKSAKKVSKKTKALRSVKRLSSTRTLRGGHVPVETAGCVA